MGHRLKFFRLLILFTVGGLAALPAGLLFAETQSPPQQLAEALGYYYDAEYEKALPLFQRIAEREETLDLMFWTGTSAANLGRHELAVEKFQAMLKKNPDLNRVRLELADVYIKTGQLAPAKRELETVRATNPPTVVIRNIDRRLAMIQKAGEKARWNLIFSQGIQWDDNASSGPDTKQLDVTGGTLTLSDTQSELESTNWLTKLGAGLRYDLGAPQRWVWSAGINFFNSVNLDHGEFNFRLLDLSTGPWWVGKRDIVKLPVGFTDTNYGSDRLSGIFHADPSIEHFFTPRVSVQAAYTYADEDYREEKVAGSDNQLHRITVGPNIYLGKRRHVLSATYSFEDRDADFESNSYEANVLTGSYFTKLPTRTEVFVFYRWFKREYKDNPPLYADEREDKRHTVSATVSQRFFKNYFASLGYTYMDNDSNAGLYDFDKNMVTFNVGVNF